MLRSFYIVGRWKLQGHGHKVKKVLPQGILMWNMKALALTVQKV